MGRIVVDSAEGTFEHGIVLSAVEVVEAVVSLVPYLAGVHSSPADTRILEGASQVALDCVRNPHFPSGETTLVEI